MPARPGKNSCNACSIETSNTNQQRRQDRLLLDAPRLAESVKTDARAVAPISRSSIQRRKSDGKLSCKTANYGGR